MIVLPGGALSDKATEFGVVQIQFFEIPRGLHASNQKKRIMKMLCSTYIFWICSYVRFCFEDKRLRRPVHALHVGLIPGLLCPPSLTQEAQLWRTDLRWFIHIHDLTKTFSYSILSIKVNSRRELAAGFTGKVGTVRWVYVLPAPRRCGMGLSASWPLASWDVQPRPGNMYSTYVLLEERQVWLGFDDMIIIWSYIYINYQHLSTTIVSKDMIFDKYQNVGHIILHFPDQSYILI